MSIIIAAFDPKGECVFYADRKWARVFPNGETHSEGEIEKIYWITDNIACGFTGIATWGCGLATKLNKSVDRNASDLIQIIKEYPYPNNVEGSTFILMGKYDDDHPFIFTYKTCGEFHFEQERSMDVFATSPEELNKSCQEIFFKEWALHKDLDQACIKTIKFASLECPQYISQSYDVIKIPYQPS